VVARKWSPYFREKNRNPEGRPKECMNCREVFTSFMPINLLTVRGQRCPKCNAAQKKATTERLNALPKSPERQKELRRAWRERNRGKVAAYMREWNSKRRLLEAPVPEVWPYAATAWPVGIVNSLVSKEMPEQVRADICQELCLMLIAGEVDEESLARALPSVRRKAYGNYALSLDWRREDGYSLADRLEGYPT
jgi:hypothetical protein